MQIRKLTGDSLCPMTPAELSAAAARGTEANGGEISTSTSIWRDNITCFTGDRRRTGLAPYRFVQRSVAEGAA